MSGGKKDQSTAHTRPSLARNHLSAAHLRPQGTITPADQIDNPFAQLMPPAPSHPAANRFVHNFPLGPNGMPIPPPPPFHRGPWPPPPPNMPLPYGNQYPMGGFMPPPPPQGLQPGWQPTGQQYSHHSPPPPPPPQGSQGGWHPPGQQYSYSPPLPARNAQGHYYQPSGPDSGNDRWRRDQDSGRR